MDVSQLWYYRYDSSLHCVLYDLINSVFSGGLSVLLTNPCTWTLNCDQYLNHSSCPWPFAHYFDPSFLWFFPSFLSIESFFFHLRGFFVMFEKPCTFWASAGQKSDFQSNCRELKYDPSEVHLLICIPQPFTVCFGSLEIT